MLCFHVFACLMRFARIVQYTHSWQFIVKAVQTVITHNLCISGNVFACCDSEETLKKQQQIHTSPIFCPCSVVSTHVTGVLEYVDISIKKLVVIVTLLNKYSKTVFCP